MFTPLNLIVFVGFIVFTTWISQRLAGRAHTSRGFFQAEGGMSWWVVSLSMVASATSTVTFLAVPTFVFAPGGSLAYVVTVWAFGLGSILVGVLFARPYFETREANTVIDYVSLRLSPRIARLSLVLSYTNDVLSSSLRVLATSLVLSVIARWPVLPSIAGVLVLSILWSAVAGIRTVIWTDFIMYLFFTGGAAFSAVWIFFQLGLAPGDAIAELGRHGKLGLIDLSLDPAKSFTLWTALFGATLLQLNTASNQGVFQRIRSCRSVADARRAYVGFAFFSVTPYFMMVVGLALFLFYQRHALPADVLAQLKTQPDRIFPHFIFTELPDGISGLIIIAIMAAGISTHNSNLTELADVTVNNIYRPFLRRSASDAHYLKASKVALIAVGLLYGALAYSVSFFQESGLLKLAFQLPGYVGGIGLGTILLARLGRRVALGAYVCGVILSASAVVGLQRLGVGFWWWYPVGAVTLMVCSLAWPRPHAAEATSPKSAAASDAR